MVMLISKTLVIGLIFFLSLFFFVNQWIHGLRCAPRTDFEVSQRFLVYILRVRYWLYCSEGLSKNTLSNGFWHRYRNISDILDRHVQSLHIRSCHSNLSNFTQFFRRIEVHEIIGPQGTLTSNLTLIVFMDDNLAYLE